MGLFSLTITVRSSISGDTRSQEWIFDSTKLNQSKLNRIKKQIDSWVDEIEAEEKKDPQRIMLEDEEVAPPPPPPSPSPIEPPAPTGPPGQGKP